MLASAQTAGLAIIQSVPGKLKSNVTRLSQSQKQSYNLQLDYNLGGVVCGGCTGGAVYTKLRVGS